METQRTESQILAGEVVATTTDFEAYWKSVVGRLIFDAGDDANRADLRETPIRLLHAFHEMLGGYKDDPSKYLNVKFESNHDEMVVVKELPFVSLCEHHMLPFTGTVAVGYIPDKFIVGLSKIPRAVQALAQRLQVQERLTGEIADAFNTTVQPKGVGVWVKANHTCMSCRGVRSAGSMITSSMRGVFKDHSATRAEFLEAVRSQL